MDVFNRVFIALTALLASLGMIALDGWPAAAFEAIRQFTVDNFLIVTPISLSVLVIIAILSLFWFRAQFGPISEDRLLFSEGRPGGDTSITADTLEKALRRTAEQVPGITAARSKLNLRQDSINAELTVVILPDKNIDRTDALLRSNVTRDWNRMFGIRPTRLDVVFKVAQEVPRAA